MSSQAVASCGAAAVSGMAASTSGQARTGPRGDAGDILRGHDGVGASSISALHFVTNPNKSGFQALSSHLLITVPSNAADDLFRCCQVRVS